MLLSQNLFLGQKFGSRKKFQLSDLYVYTIYINISTQIFKEIECGGLYVNLEQGHPAVRYMGKCIGQQVWYIEILFNMIFLTP